MITKENLVGKRFRAAPNGTGQLNYISDSPRDGYIRVHTNPTLEKTTMYGEHSVKFLNECFNNNTWKLIEENMTKEDLLNKQFQNKNDTSTTYTIYKIEGDQVWMNWPGDRTGTYYASQTVLNNIAIGAWIVINMQPAFDDKNFEVGDVVRSKTNDYDMDQTITSISGGRVEYKEGGWDRLSDMLKHYDIISKGNKQEIIGYELLKDFPNVKAGTKSNAVNGDWYGFALINPRGAAVNYSVNKEDLQDTTWFKPIYKSQEIAVKFSNYTATLSKSDGLVFTDGERIEFNELVKLTKELVKVVNAKTLGSYGAFRVNVTLNITAVQVGCKSFDAEDITKIQQALKKLN